MCSTPKGRSSRSIRHNEIQCLTEEMSADEYTALVQHANQSYEQRQYELKRLRAEGKLPASKLRKAPVKHDDSMLQRLFKVVSDYMKKAGWIKRRGFTSFTG